MGRIGKKKRRHSKIDELDPELKRIVEDLLQNDKATYADIVDILAGEGITISASSVSRYAKNFYENRQLLNIANENFQRIAEEIEKYPDLDITEATLRVLSNHLFGAVSKLSEDDFEDIDIVDLLKQCDRLVRASAYKKRTDIQNKEAYDNGVEKIKSLVFEAMAREEPDLYKMVVTFLNKKKAEGEEGLKDERD